MTTSKNGSNCGSQYGNNITNWSNASKSTNWTATATATAPAISTCAEPAYGNTYDVNEIPAAGCYVCNWNGSLLRVSEAAFTSGGFTSFNFTNSDPLTVTYISGDPAATLEECRTNATGTNVYCNF